MQSIEPNWVSLQAVRKGERFVVRRIDDKQTRAQLLRFGLAEGSDATCFERLPLGPIVVKRRRQEVAIGAELSEKIWVEVIAN
ncbi:MAG: ferrous iron transport protein A [Chloroherpetonaceae bacterium]|nr:ferrous iron transport protein A [Chloroherpetonaceae bacterium]MDW8438803.1 FeoA family protein [Chloroherpetonaceae bacterium]